MLRVEARPAAELTLTDALAILLGYVAECARCGGTGRQRRTACAKNGSGTRRLRRRQKWTRCPACRRQMQLAEALAGGRPLPLRKAEAVTLRG